MAQIPKELPIPQLLAFFRFLRKDQREPIAIQIFLDEVENGIPPEKVLRGRDFTLKVKKLAERTYTINFACNPGPMVGDGGTWEVEFDNEGEVKSTVEKERWIS